MQVKVNELSAHERIKNFSEVVLGYSQDEALKEANRCLQCDNPACISGCPVGINIKKFIKEIIENNYLEAFKTIREKNNFASICGRVCPAEYQCRLKCVLTKKGSSFASDSAINIHFLERFVGDWAINNLTDLEIKKKKTKFKAAVVGSGPAGLCCAGELARFGVKVVIFESLHKSGGVLRYGIPEFRLPQEILDFEINYLKKMGVEIKTNIIIGKTKTVDDLLSEKFDAIFLGLGAGIPSFLNIEGENLANIYSANEFLTRVNLMQAYKFPEYHTPINVGKKIVVIGGGNTAMDSARVALRLQKMSGFDGDVTICYRRSENEMPARRLEIEHAKEEGIKFELLSMPLRFSGENKVKETELVKCKLTEPDSSGRRRPKPIDGSNFKIFSDQVIVAIGLKANQLLLNEYKNIETDSKGDIIVDNNMQTSVKNIYAGGDIVGGQGTVIEAMGMAKKAAKTILNKFGILE